MEAVCYLPSAICALSVFAYLTFSFAVLAPLAAARLNQLKKRRESNGHAAPVGTLQLA